MDNQKIGKYIAMCRKKKGYTQQSLADILGVTNKAVSKWETGTGIPDISILPHLAETLNVTVDDILRGSDSQKVLDDPIVETTMKVTPKFYREYLQCVYYDHFYIQVILFILGLGLIGIWYCLPIVCRYYFYIETPSIYTFFLVLGICCFLLMIFGYYVFCFRQIPEYKYSIYKDSLKYREGNKEVQYFYSQIEKIIETKNGYVLKIGKRYIYLQGVNQEGIDVLSLTMPIISYRKNLMSIIKRFIQLILIIIMILMVSLELGYHLILKKYGFEYIFDGMAFLHIYIIIICLLSFFILKQVHGKKLRIILISMFMSVGVGILGCIFFSDTVLSVGPGMKNSVILKTDPQGETALYRYPIACFALKKTNLTYPIHSDLKLQWTTNDICTLTYLSTDQQVHQYVATYGDRGNGISYNYVQNYIYGIWQSDIDNQLNYSVHVQNGEIKINYGNMYEVYNSEDCVQFGTIALVLCDDNSPRWTISMGEDIELNENDSVIKGHIILTPVSLSDMDSISLEIVTKQDNEELEDHIFKEMLDIIEADPSLSSFQQVNRLYKMQTDSDDMFIIAKDALESSIQASDTMKETIQIHNIEILAGDKKDFLIEMRYLFTLSNPDKNEKYETYMEQKFRIMKGEGDCYLVKQLLNSEDGDHGLRKLDAPQRLVTSQLKQFYFEIEKND